MYHSCTRTILVVYAVSGASGHKTCIFADHCHGTPSCRRPDIPCELRHSIGVTSSMHAQYDHPSAVLAPSKPRHRCSWFGAAAMPCSRRLSHRQSPPQYPLLTVTQRLHHLVHSIPVIRITAPQDTREVLLPSARLHSWIAELGLTARSTCEMGSSFRSASSSCALSFFAP